jgi:hypothetical protein
MDALKEWIRSRRRPLGDLVFLAGVLAMLWLWLRAVPGVLG